MERRVQTIAAAGSIMETLAGEEVLGGFARAVSDAGFAGLLSGNDEYTVFAPSNTVLGEFFESVGVATFERPDRLAELVAFHIVPGVFSVECFRESAVLPTVSGRMLPVDRSRIMVPDIRCRNGVIHVLNGVFIPR